MCSKSSGSDAIIKVAVVQLCFLVLTLTMTTWLLWALTKQIMTDVLGHSFVLPTPKTSLLMMPSVKQTKLKLTYPGAGCRTTLFDPILNASNRS